MKVNRYGAASLIAAVGLVLQACAYNDTEADWMNPYPPNPVAIARPSQRVYAYADGRYELRGDGTSASPYSWEWIPTGAQPATPPPLPPLPAGG